MGFDRKVKYEEVAKAVGHVCVAWADLEWQLVCLASDLSKVIAPEYKDRRLCYPFEIALSQTDMREKIMIVKVLAHTARGDATFYDDLCTVVNEIDNDLRPQRNRYVHDHWLSGEEQILRIHHSPKIFQPQANQRKMHRRSVHRYSQTDEMFCLVDQIEEARAKVIELAERTSAFPRLEELPSE